MKKVFYLFAGVNGAGKSTLYNSESLNNDIKNTIRINTDQLKAAKIAINLRN